MVVPPPKTVPTTCQDLASHFLQGIGGAHDYKASECCCFVRKCNLTSFRQTHIVLLHLMACMRAQAPASPLLYIQQRWKDHYVSLKAAGQVSRTRIHLSKWHPGIVLVSVQ